jgi:hypothetical protein
MTQRLGHNFDRSAARRRGGRRGSIYAVVLAMAILVSLIGLSAVAVGRINLRTASAGGDAAAAELLALSGIEHAVAVVNADSNWRTNYTHDQSIAPVALGTGEFTWKLQDGTLDFNPHDGVPDDTDGSLSGGLQPVRVVSNGRVGDARRSYSVVLVPAGANLLTNPGVESGPTPYEIDNCVLEVNSSAAHNGLRSLLVKGRAGAAAGPRQDVTAKVNRNKWYYVEAWVRMTTAEEEPVICLVATGGGGDQVSRPTRAAGAPAQKVGTDWKKVSYSINTNWSSGGYNNVYWRVETSATNQDFYLDDVKLIESATPMPMAPASDTWRQEQLN